MILHTIISENDIFNSATNMCSDYDNFCQIKYDGSNKKIIDNFATDPYYYLQNYFK